MEAEMDEIIFWCIVVWVALCCLAAICGYEPHDFDASGDPDDDTCGMD